MKRYIRIILSSPLLMIIIVLIVGLSAATIYFYNKSKSSGPEGSVVEIAKLERELGKIILLPENEVPTLATVADPEQLKDQPFFADAKKGDKVLIYTTARKAILYDPKAKKIINVGPVAIGENNPSVLTETAQ